MPPSRHGVPRVGSPASLVLSGTPTSCHPSRAAWSPSLRGTAAAPWASFPQSQDATAAGRDCLLDSQTGFIDGSDRTSQVPGGPHYERALLCDPGGTSALGHYRASMLSSANWKASTPTTNTNFGAQSHGLYTRCLRFAGWITPPLRKTRFRMAGQPCPGGTEYPQGPNERFQIFSFSFPRLRLAHPNLNIKVGHAALSKSGDITVGVTTAATLWLVTVIGLCIGGGKSCWVWRRLHLYLAPLGNRATNSTRSKDQRGSKWQTSNGRKKCSAGRPSGGPRRERRAPRAESS